MSTDAKMAKHAIHDELEAQIKTAEAKLATLKARAETTKANFELKAIAGLLPKEQAIRHKLQELKVSSGEQLERAKADLVARIADLEQSVKDIEARFKEKQK